MRNLYARDDYLWLAVLVTVILMWIPLFKLSIEGGLVDSWGYTELLINWSGGFVRRGLYGTLAIGFHKVTGHGVVRLTAFLFIVLTLAQIFFLFWLLREHRKNYILIVLVGLSPTMLLFPVYDIDAYWRKETFLNFAVLFHAILARLCLDDRLSYRLYTILFASVLLPLLLVNTLIYEVQGLFLTIHIAISLSVYRHYLLLNEKLAEVTVVPLGYCLVFVPFVLSIFAHGDPHTSKIMFDSVRVWSGAPADFGAYAPGWTNAIDAHALSLGASHETARMILTDPVSVLAYLAAFLVGPVMLYMLIRSQIDVGYAPSVWPFFPGMVLFLVGYDYGRWIHIIAISTVAYTLHFPRNYSLSKVLPRESSYYSWISPFLLVSWTAFYTLGWHLPHYPGDNFYNFSGEFIPAWLKLFDIFRNVF